MKNLLNSKYNSKIIGLNFLLTILFTIWPLSAFILSVITFKNKFSRLIFVLFWGLWGFSRTLIYGHDSTEWTLEFMRYSGGVTFKEFVELKIITLGAQSTDFLYSFYLFIISEITSSTSWFWLITSIIFVFIYTKCFATILKKNSRYNLYLFILFILFIFFIPRTAYGVRFYFAILLYIYSVIKIIIYEKKRYLFLLILTPMIHFSFFIGLVAYLFYHITHYRSRPHLYLSVIILAAIIFGLTIQFSAIGDSFTSFTAIGKKIEGYGEASDRADNYASRSTFIIVDMFLYTLYALFIVVSIRSREIVGKIKYNQINNGLNNFNYFLLVFFSLLIFFVNFPDVLVRFSIVFTLMTILYFTRVYISTKDRSIYLNNLIIFAIVFWGFHLLINFRRSISLMDLNLLKGSIISILTGSTELPIIF